MPQNRSRVEFYTILGSAITSWVSIERALFRVFLSALDGADPAAAAAAYYSLQGFKPKLDVTSSALEARMSRHPLDSYNGHTIKRHAVLDDWFGVKGTADRKRESLRAKIRSASEERNKLAHYDTVDMTGDDGVTKHVLSKSSMNPLNWQFAFGEGVYDFDKILLIQNGFNELYREIEAFVSSVNLALGQESISMLAANSVRDPRPVIDRTQSKTPGTICT